MQFKEGAKVVSSRRDWTNGLVGTVVKDDENLASISERLVEFNRKEANNEGHGPKSNRWYVYTSELKLVPADALTLGTPNLADDLRLPPQARKILAHLLSSKTITNLESMMVYHIPRLSDCILKIRRAGYKVSMTVKRDEVGGKYASYKLAA